MTNHELARLLDGAYSDGYLNRERALRDFGAQHYAALAVELATGDGLVELLRQANVGAPEHWAVFVLEGALLADASPNVAEAWFSTLSHTTEVCVALAARSAIRVLPLLNCFPTIQQPAIRASLLLPSFWGTSAAWLIATWPDLLGEVGTTNLRPRLRRHIEVEPSHAAALAADFVIDYEFSGVSDYNIPELASETFRTAQAAIQRYAPSLDQAFRVAFARDATSAARHSEPPDLRNLSLSPLWPQGTPAAIADHWRRLATQLELLDEDWDVWTHWYNGRLAGRPAHQDIESDRVSVAQNHLIDDPAQVNRAIRQRIDEHVAARFPDRQPLTIDGTKTRFTLAPAEIPDDQLFARACDQLVDSLEPFSAQRFSNLYADLTDPVQLLSRALEERRDSPLIVHRRIRQAAREIDRRMQADDALADDFNVRTLLEDLNDAAVAIPTAVPAVAEEITKRAQSRLGGLLPEERNAIQDAAAVLARNSDDPVRELVEDGIRALNAGKPGEPLADSDSESVYTLGWILAKLPALKRTALVSVALVADLQGVFAAVAKVYHLLLGLFL